MNVNMRLNELNRFCRDLVIVCMPPMITTPQWCNAQYCNESTIHTDLEEQVNLFLSKKNKHQANHKTNQVRGWDENGEEEGKKVKGLGVNELDLRWP